MSRVRFINKKQVKMETLHCIGLEIDYELISLKQAMDEGDEKEIKKIKNNLTKLTNEMSELEKY